MEKSTLDTRGLLNLSPVLHQRVLKYCSIPLQHHNTFVCREILSVTLIPTAHVLIGQNLIYWISGHSSRSAFKNAASILDKKIQQQTNKRNKPGIQNTAFPPSYQHNSRCLACDAFLCRHVYQAEPPIVSSSCLLPCTLETKHVCCGGDPADLADVRRAETSYRGDGCDNKSSCFTTFTSAYIPVINI